MTNKGISGLWRHRQRVIKYLNDNSSLFHSPTRMTFKPGNQERIPGDENVITKRMIIWKANIIASISVGNVSRKEQYCKYEYNKIRSCLIIKPLM